MWDGKNKHFRRVLTKENDLVNYDKRESNNKIKYK